MASAGATGHLLEVSLMSHPVAAHPKTLRIVQAIHDTALDTTIREVAAHTASSPSMMNPTEWLTLALVVATFALVVITAYYAIQTRRTVVEMRAAREAQVAPRLVPTIAMLGPTFVAFRVLNAGPGPALDVDCELALAPDGPKWRWTWPILSSGAHQDFTPQGKHPDGTPFAPQSDQVLKHYKSLNLTSTCKDALGREHRHEDRAELAQTIGSLGEAGVHFTREPVSHALSQAGKLIEQVVAIRAALENLARRG